MTKEQQALWHDIAVGMFYREQAASNPKVYYHWEQQSLSNKLHYQAKAKLALKEAIAMPARKAIVEVSGGVAEVTECPDGVEIEIIDHDNLDDEPSPCRQHKDTGRGVCCYCGVAI